MPDSLEIIMYCVYIADEVLAHDLTREELLETLRQISSIGKPTLSTRHGGRCSEVVVD